MVNAKTCFKLYNLQTPILNWHYIFSLVLTVGGLMASGHLPSTVCCLILVHFLKFGVDVS